MKQILRWPASILAVACVFFSLTDVSEAGGKGKPLPKIPYTAIASVDTAAKTITVGPKNSTATGTKTYKFTDKTIITTSGKPGTVADLAPGQQIHVGTGMDETIAEELTVTPPPADPQYSGHKP